MLSISVVKCLTQVQLNTQEWAPSGGAEKEQQVNSIKYPPSKNTFLCSSLWPAPGPWCRAIWVGLVKVCDEGWI